MSKMKGRYAVLSGQNTNDVIQCESGELDMGLKGNTTHWASGIASPTAGKYTLTNDFEDPAIVGASGPLNNSDKGWNDKGNRLRAPVALKSTIVFGVTGKISLVGDVTKAFRTFAADEEVEVIWPDVHGTGVRSVEIELDAQPAAGALLYRTTYS